MPKKMSVRKLDQIEDKAGFIDTLTEVQRAEVSDAIGMEIEEASEEEIAFFRLPSGQILLQIFGSRGEDEFVVISGLALSQ